MEEIENQIKDESQESCASDSDPSEDELSDSELIKILPKNTLSKK